MSERRACRVVRQWRGTQRYLPLRRTDEDAADASDPGPGREVWAVRLPAHHGAVAGCAGWPVGKDRVQRIWRREGLKVPQKQRARGRLWLGMVRVCACVRSMRIMCGATILCKAMTHDGRALRILVVIDEYTRECLALRVAAALGEFAGDRNAGGCDVGAGDTRSTFVRTMGRSSLPGSCGSGWASWARRRCISSLGARGRTGTARASTGS